MRIVPVTLIHKNINHHYEITSETQDCIRIGLAQYLVETGKSLQLQSKSSHSSSFRAPDVVSIAIMYTQIFFLKKCYLNYDKEIIANAALFLSSKNLNMKRKVQDFIIPYQKSKSMGSLYRPLSDPQKNEIIDELCVAECQILKITGFDLDIDLPYRYIDRFHKYMYPENSANMFRFATAVCNDSFYTYVNIIFSSQSIAVACIIFAAVKYNVPQPSDPEFSNWDTVFDSLYLRTKYPQYQPKMIGSQEIISSEEKTKLREEFEQKPWYKRIDEQCDIEEVVESLRMIQEFYTSIENNRQTQQQDKQQLI